MITRFLTATLVLVVVASVVLRVAWTDRGLDDGVGLDAAEALPVEEPSDEMPERVGEEPGHRSGVQNSRALERHSNLPIADPSQLRIEAAQATSAGQLQQVAERARFEGDETLARHIELVEEGLCGPLVRDDLSSAVVQDGLGFQALEGFCKDSAVDTAADPGELRAELLQKELALAEAVLDEYLDLLQWMSSEDAFRQILVDSASPEGIRGANLLVANGDIDVDLLSAVLGEGRRVDVDTQRILHNTVADLYGCERFNHCGPDSMIVIERCLFAMECEPGFDYADLVELGFSPQELLWMSRMLDSIRQFESRGGP